MIPLKNKPNVESPSTEYPFGSIQDKIAMVQSGTPVNRLVYNDIHQFFEKMFDYMKKTGNGVVDNAANGFELFDALLEFIEIRKNIISEFTIGVSALDNDWYDVTYGAGKWVAISQSGTAQAMVSNDGLSWSLVTVPATAYYSIAYGNGKFIAGGDTLGLSNVIATSTDGLTWTAGTLSFPFGIQKLKFINGKFFATASGTPTNAIAYSTDGITWTDATTPNVGSNIVQDITFGNGIYVAVLSGGTDRILTSTDGITWTAQTPPVNRQFTAVAYGNGLFVVTSSSSGFITKSTDGITWVDVAVPNIIYTDCVYGAGKFIIIARTGSGNRVNKSYDGITWTPETSVDNSWRAIDYKDGLFVGVSSSGTGNRVFTMQ